jgi:integrase
MAKKLTDIAVKNMKPTGTPREIPDGGARGLYLLMGRTGTKSYIVRFRHKGKPKKLTIGRADAITLAEARKAAADAMAKVAHGIDPAAEKQDAKREQRAIDADTFQFIAEDYQKRVGSKLRSGHAQMLMLRRAVFPIIGDRPISMIRRKEIVRMLDRIEDERGPVSADRSLALISVIMNYHARRDDTFIVPLVRGMGRSKPHERARKRVLSDDELRAFWKCTAEMGPFGALMRFLVLTASRRNEAASMQWSEIKDGHWTCPKERSKNKIEIVRPLSAASLGVLVGQPQVEGNPYIFSHGRGPIANFSKPKRLIDAAMIAELRKTDPQATMEQWQIHDVRRTAATLMGRAEVPHEHIERCLAHVIPGVAGVYQRHKYLPQMQMAYDKLARLLVDRIVNPPAADAADNVIELRPTEVSP